MRPFQLSHKTKARIAQQERRKDLITRATVSAIEGVLIQGVSDAVDNALRGLPFDNPDGLGELYDVSLDFYRQVIKAAVTGSREDYDGSGVKHLARTPKGKMPSTLPELEEFFRGPQWRHIAKRSRVLTDRLRRVYLDKLRKRFGKIAPLLEAGKISPAEVKAELMKGFNATKGRVENLFRTETTSYYARTQVAFFSGSDGIIGFLFDSVRDVSRTDICRSRHGLIYRPGTALLAKNTPACHWFCRSHLIPLADTPFNRKLLADPTRDPAKRSVVALPNGWNK